jgi:hypothetical protein
MTSAYERALHIPPGSSNTVRSAAGGPDPMLSHPTATSPSIFDPRFSNRELPRVEMPKAPASGQGRRYALLPPAVVS